MYHKTLKNVSSDRLSRFKLNLKNFLQGFTFLKSLPSVAFFNSVRNSYWATGEAYAMRIPAGGVTDTDSLPDSVLYPIPGNDDAFGSLFFLNKLVAKVVLISKMTRMFVAYNKFCVDFIERTIKVFESRIRRLKRRRRERKRLERLRALKKKERTHQPI